MKKLIKKKHDWIYVLTLAVILLSVLTYSMGHDSGYNEAIEKYKEPATNPINMLYALLMVLAFGLAVGWIIHGVGFTIIGKM